MLGFRKNNQLVVFSLRRKVLKKIVALLLAFSLSNSASAGGFVGADLSSSFGYPDSTNLLVDGFINNGFSSANAQQKSGTLGFGVVGGKWFSEKLGWEFGYAKLGSGVDGSFSTTGPTRAGTYDYTASAFHMAILGGTKAGDGKIYGKVGLYRSSTESKWAYTVGSTSSSTGSNSNMGLMMGVGYEMPINANLSTRFGADIYNGVEFQEISNSTKVQKMLYRMSLGLIYNY